MNPLIPSHSPNRFHNIFNSLTTAQDAAVWRATYYTLEACSTWGDQVVLASIEDAEDAGDFRIHVGLPDRPDMRSVFIFSALSDAVQVLGALKGMRDVPLWLSALEIEAEIRGADVWAALVAARASLDPTDTDCPWVQLAADLASGQATRASYGTGKPHWLYAEIAKQIGRA